MSYMNNIFKRGNIIQLREFLLYGQQLEESRLIEESRIQDYKEKLDKSYEKFKEIMLTYDDMYENSDLSTAIDEFLIEYEEIYMEIGILIGFYMAKEINDKQRNLDLLLGEFKSDVDELIK